jgi:PleD family two-component response regulator
MGLEQDIVITNEYTKYKDTAQIMNNLIQIHKLADVPARSNYLIERPKIEGVDSVENKEYNNKILIYETDEALSVLLNTIFQLQGYDTKLFNEYSIPEKDYNPALIIVDAGDLEKKNGLNLCYSLRQNDAFKDAKIIVTSVIHDKELVLNTGADLYVPKPYEIPNLVRWVNEFIKEYNT